MVFTIPKDKSQEKFLGFIFYSDGLLSVIVIIKPNMIAKVPSNTIKV
jgi:hypothetical protein